MKCFTYECTNRRCAKYHERLPSAASPTDYRNATGRSVACDACYRPLRLVKIEKDWPANLPGGDQ